MAALGLPLENVELPSGITAVWLAGQLSAPTACGAEFASRSTATVPENPAASVPLCSATRSSENALLASFVNRRSKFAAPGVHRGVVYSQPSNWLTADPTVKELLVPFSTPPVRVAVMVQVPVLEMVTLQDASTPL